MSHPVPWMEYEWDDNVLQQERDADRREEELERQQQQVNDEVSE